MKDELKESPLLLTRSAGEFLSLALERKKTNQPQLSLRWLSRRIRTSPSYLSQIFQDLRNVPIEITDALAEALELTEAEENFLELVSEVSRLKYPASRQLLADEIERMRLASSGQVNIVENDIPHVFAQHWNQAVWACFDLKDFDGSEEFIATALGLKSEIVRRSLQLLQQKGLVSHDETNRWSRDANFNQNTIATQPNQWFRDYYSFIQDISHELIYAPQPKVNTIGVRVIAFDPEDLPLLEEEGRKFRERVQLIASRGKNRSKVCACYFHFFEMRGKQETAEVSVRKSANTNESALDC